MRKIVALILAACAVLALLAGCGKEPAETSAATVTGSVPASSEGDVLEERRRLVQEYMRSQLDFYWTTDVEMPYYRSKTGELEFVFLPGRIYRGLPYTPSGGTTTSFLRYETGTDSGGVHALSGFGINEDTGEVSVLQLGSDCSTTVFNAWSQVSGSISAEKRTTRWMTENNGYLRVGNYHSDPNENKDTIRVCQENGEQTMFTAYSQLQPGDAVVHYNGSGHAMLITEVSVTNNKKTGEILGSVSYVRIMDQTSGNMSREKKEYSEELGADVYLIGNLDKVYTFDQLYKAGYLPITCKELNDPAALAEETLEITASEDRAGEGLIGELLSQTVRSNRAINLVTLTISNETGETVQECSFVPAGTYARVLPLSLFVSQPSHLFKGSLDLTALAPGSYQLTCTVLSVTGKTESWQTNFEVD